jgi:hypothetical protein
MSRSGETTQAATLPLRHVGIGPPCLRPILPSVVLSATNLILFSPSCILILHQDEGAALSANRPNAATVAPGNGDVAEESAKAAERQPFGCRRASWPKKISR